MHSDNNMIGDEMDNERKCLRCGHTWYGRMDKPPVKCPKCLSPYWDKPRKTESKIQEKTMKYTVEYGSHNQVTNTIESDSRDAKRHGRELLGSAHSGFVRVKDQAGQVVSYARYGEGKWYSSVYRD